MSTVTHNQIPTAIPSDDFIPKIEKIIKEKYFTYGGLPFLARISGEPQADGYYNMELLFNKDITIRFKSQSLKTLDYKLRNEKAPQLYRDVQKYLQKDPSYPLSKSISIAFFWDTWKNAIADHQPRKWNANTVKKKTRYCCKFFPFYGISHYLLLQPMITLMRLTMQAEAHRIRRILSIMIALRYYQSLLRKLSWLVFVQVIHWITIKRF